MTQESTKYKIVPFLISKSERAFSLFLKCEFVAKILDENGALKGYEFSSSFGTIFAISILV